jgi:adenylate kinase
VFKAHYHTILRLKSYFPFSLIDAMGSLEEARQQIMRELRYQSSLDLDEATYAAIRHLPLARDLVRVARQRLVFRLDAYCKRDNKLFCDVIRWGAAAAYRLRRA